MTIKLSSCIMHMRILNFLQGSKLYVSCLNRIFAIPLNLFQIWSANLNIYTLKSQSKDPKGHRLFPE